MVRRTTDFTMRQANRKARVSETNALVSSSHPLVGAWVEVENPFDTTSVVYTISAKAGRFSVGGVDPDGVALVVSNTSWDGKRLRFVTVFPPTKHKASHEFWLTGRMRAGHKVTYSDSEGTRVVSERWRKRPPYPAMR